MRSLALLALCLGLFAVAQALDLPQGVLLKQMLTDEELDAKLDNNVTALRGHHHFRRHGPPHDPHDHHYWRRRHSAKSELLHCLKLAHDDCDINDEFSLRAAGKRIAHCLLDHLGGCHDIPGIGGDITKTIPWIMAVKGFEALIDAGDDGLVHAQLVFEFYLVGAVVPTATQPNPWYTGDKPPACASKLAALLMSGTQKSDMKQIWALAEVVAKFIEKALSSKNDPNYGLGECAPDIVAVLASLLSTSCPQTGQLFNPLATSAADAFVRCTYKSENTYENSAPALLGGSIYSLLLLSGKPKLQKLAVEVAFAGLRMAVAASQTSDFFQCVGYTPTTPPLPTGNPGGLAAALAAIPQYSGTVSGYPPAYAPIQPGPSPDGQRVICMSIAMMSGPAFWNQNLLWQGAADITNALYKTIYDNPGKLSKKAKQQLCLTTRAIYTFSPTPTPGAAPNQAYVAITSVIPPLPANNELDWTCSTISPKPNCLFTPSWASTTPELVSGHDLGQSSPYFQVCGNPALWQ